MAGTAIPATNAIPTGAPTNVPSCHRSFFFRDHGFFPQNVHPDGLKQKQNRILSINLDSLLNDEPIIVAFKQNKSIITLNSVGRLSLSCKANRIRNHKPRKPCDCMTRHPF